ncbi:MAG: methyltransferase domain-containing protein, partial [Rhodoferax sp.]|nr:methyltransferase domain-containing protein [Rhodoferax sp.]
GIDPSTQSIEYACETYARPQIHFERGTLEENTCPESSVDTFLMFETLEHTQNPNTALANVRRCLKPDGLLMGSVPSAEYEALCERTYGPNPFHLQRFTKDQIVHLLGEYFESVRIFSMEFVLGSLVHSMDEQLVKDAEIAAGVDGRVVGVAGSIVFLAGSANRIAQAINEVGAPNKFFPSIPKVVLDRDEVEPIRTAMQSVETMVRERDEVIASQGRMLEERSSIMQSMDAMVRERDELIASQRRVLEERSSIMQSMDAMVRERDELIANQADIFKDLRYSLEADVRNRDEVIASQGRVLEERSSIMQSMDAMVRERDKVIENQTRLLEKLPTASEAMKALLKAVIASLRSRMNKVLGTSRKPSINSTPLGSQLPNTHDLFPELATSFFYFVDRLYETLTEQGIQAVYFLSREGQPLMRMFDMYCKQIGAGIVSHYLEVSRRSTLLPSLAPLAEENFETLFRQYRRISLLEFLSSLGLEVHLENIAQALGMADGAASQREDDFPSSSTFTALKALPQFQELYESERQKRRGAFIAYLAALSGGTLPPRLVIVDVGWKGTIQDNLFALLCRHGDTPVRHITGYYIGLVAQGAAGSCNDKCGLLFSTAGVPSPKFQVFNENRALLEVVLAANHGSISSYTFNADGQPCAIRGEFEEGEMLAAEVLPVQHQLMAHFKHLVLTNLVFGKRRPLPLQKVVQAHARMVFNPTPRERAWFTSVFHVENYGVFERSHFVQPDKPPRLFERLRFLMHLLLQRRLGTTGFWPWNTIYERGGALPAAIYAAMRRLQR